ncbi:MAG: hypothetical protein M1840_008221 [Geoglossum simile]|nr:MAG: hypothetical protein M1840_008221 [Geoglossum simile]
MEPVGLFKPTTTRPLSQLSRKALGKEGSGAFGVTIRDNFHLSTWLLLGACMQSLLILLLPSRFALAPAFLIISCRLLDTAFMTASLKKNPLIEESIPWKFSAQIPDAQGGHSKEPSSSDVCVFLLGGRSNHPLGMFAPGMKELGNFFSDMVDDLENTPRNTALTPTSVLGASSWLSTDRPATNEVTTIFYFRSFAHLHKFAHSPSHRKGWTWWNANLAKQPHIGIMHELYQVSKSNWESIYVNYHPTGLAATTYLAKPTAADEKPTWVSPIVDAKKGRLRSSAGRMARDIGDGNEKYRDDPYA